MKIFGKQKIIKILIVFCALIIGIIVAEIFTRAVLDSQNKKAVLGFYQEDEFLAQSLRPNASGILQSRAKGEFKVNIKTTSQGFRDIKEYEVPKPINTYRILMLGDSFTLGHGVEVEETFAKVLEKSLNSKFGDKRFEVINAAYASGFTWDEAYLFTKEKGLIYQPDLVIENIWTGNDLIEIGEHVYPKIDENDLPQKIISNRTYVTEDGYLKQREAPPRKIKGFVGYVNETVCDNLQICKTILRPFVERKIKILSNRTNNSRPQSPYVNFLLRDLDLKTQENWDAGKNMLLALDKITKDSGTKFMIVNIPVKEQIHDPYGILHDKELNEKRIEEFAKNSQIAYCDITSDLKGNPKESFFKNDAHLTKIGHRLAAYAIEEYLIAQNFF